MKKVVEGFLPSKNGLHFGNVFDSVPYEFDILGVRVHVGCATNGVCGGMVFAVRDIFETGLMPPKDKKAPSEGEFFNYLCNRLKDSFNLPFGPMVYMKFMNPQMSDGEKKTEGPQIPFMRRSRAYVMIKEEWPRIKKEIDSGRLCPIGLVKAKSWDPALLGKNHQVMVYGYTLEGNTLTLHIYDPNEPDDDSVTLSLDIGDVYKGAEVRSSHPSGGAYSDVYCFFKVRYEYQVPRGIEGK